MQKLWNGTGYLLRRVARVVEGWLPRGRQRVFFEQLPERKILVAARRRIQRVGRILIENADVKSTDKTQSLIERPAKILPRSRHDFQRFPRLPTDISKIENPRIPIRRIMTARLGFEHHATGIAQTQDPHPRARRPRIGRIVVGIARNSIPCGRIQPQHLPVETVHHLRAKGADVFLGPDDPISQTLDRVTADKVPAHVGPKRTAPIPARNQQRSVLTENQAAHSMRIGQDRNSRLPRLPQQDQPAGQIHRPETIRRAARVARQPPDRGRIILIRVRVVTWRAEIHQVMPIYDVQQIDVTVDPKVGVQRQAQHPVVAPGPDFLVNVQQQGKRNIARVLEPHLPRSLPDVSATVVFEHRSHRVAPGPRDDRLGKTRRHRRRRKFTQARRPQAGYDYDN